MESAKAQGFEGLVAKRANRGQEFVIGGYTVGGNPFDALIFGYYEGDRLLYAGRTRSGFTAAARGAVQAVQGT